MTDAHRHDWEIVMTELGDTCPCGHERLLTGTVLRGRTKATHSWEMPELWNPPKGKRQRADGA